MIACKRIVTFEDQARVVLSNLPFQPGQRVEIVLIAEEEKPGETTAELRRLLKETQALPAAQRITDDQIAEEVAAYRVPR